MPRLLHLVPAAREALERLEARSGIDPEKEADE